MRTILHEDVAKLSDTQLEDMIRSIYRLDEINLQRYTKGEGGYHHWFSEHYLHLSDQSQRSIHRVLLRLIIFLA